MKLLSLSCAALFLSNAATAAASDLRLIDAVKSGDVKAVRALLAQHVPQEAVEAGWLHGAA